MNYAFLGYTEVKKMREEGRVIFYNGAGISYLTGLPEFMWLVDEIRSIALLVYPLQSVRKMLTRSVSLMTIINFNWNGKI